uniref:Uncharacterized protein n=1 Tax=Salvator merianae TaxID=96440 RepID=A0A8D0EAP6_SALMN
TKCESHPPPSVINHGRLEGNLSTLLTQQSMILGQSDLCERFSSTLELTQPPPHKNDQGMFCDGSCHCWTSGHGFIPPENAGYVPLEEDEVTYKICPIPSKNQKFQVVKALHAKHETWSGQIIGS